MSCNAKTAPVVRSSSIPMTNLLLKLQGFEDEAKNFPEGTEYPIERAKEFYDLFLPFSIVINDMAKRINELRELFDNEFKAKGIDLSKNDSDSHKEYQK